MFNARRSNASYPRFVARPSRRAIAHAPPRAEAPRASPSSPPLQASRLEDERAADEENEGDPYRPSSPKRAGGLETHTGQRSPSPAPARQGEREQEAATAAHPVDGTPLNIAEVIVNMQKHYASTTESLSKKFDLVNKQLRKENKELRNELQQLNHHVGTHAILLRGTVDVLNELKSRQYAREASIEAELDVEHELPLARDLSEACYERVKRHQSRFRASRARDRSLDAAQSSTRMPSIARNGLSQLEASERMIPSREVQDIVNAANAVRSNAEAEIEASRQARGADLDQQQPPIRQPPSEPAAGSTSKRAAKRSAPITESSSPRLRTATKRRATFHHAPSFEDDYEDDDENMQDAGLGVQQQQEDRLIKREPEIRQMQDIPTGGEDSDELNGRVRLRPSRSRSRSRSGWTPVNFEHLFALSDDEEEEVQEEYAQDDEVLDEELDEDERVNLFINDVGSDYEPDQHSEEASDEDEDVRNEDDHDDQLQEEEEEEEEEIGDDEDENDDTIAIRGSPAQDDDVAAPADPSASAGTDPGGSTQSRPRYSTPRRTTTPRFASGPAGRPFRFFRMGRTVAEVWREYKLGANGNPSIQSLEERYGTGWRTGTLKEVKYASNYVGVRQKVVGKVEELCGRDGIDAAEACRRLDERVDGRMQLLIATVRKGQDPFEVIPRR